MTPYPTLISLSLAPKEYDPDAPPPLEDPEAELLLILLHRYFMAEVDPLPNFNLEAREVVDDLAMSMNHTTDLADRIRKDLG